MSKFTILWAVMLLLSFTATTYFDGALSFCMFYFLLIVPVICLLYILRRHSLLSFKQSTESDRLVVGIPEHYSFELKNKGFFAHCYNIKLVLAESYYDIEDLPKQNCFDLKPGETVKHDTYITCRYRGNYRIGVRSIIIPDYINLFRLSFKNKIHLNVFVFPRIIMLDSLKSIPDFDSVQENDFALVKDELDVPVRDYMNGDPLHHINWKATARHFSLKTRLYTGIKHCRISILIDTASIKAPQEHCLATENKIMETAIALTRYFSAKDIETSVMYFQRADNKNASFIHHRANNLVAFERFYEEFSKIDFLPYDFDFLGDTSLYSEQVIDSSIVIMIVREISTELFSYAKTLSDSGKKVNIYAITDKSQDEFISMADSSMNITQIRPEQDIEEVL